MTKSTLDEYDQALLETSKDAALPHSRDSSEEARSALLAESPQLTCFEVKQAEQMRVLREEAGEGDFNADDETDEEMKAKTCADTSQNANDHPIAPAPTLLSAEGSKVCPRSLYEKQLHQLKRKAQTAEVEALVMTKEVIVSQTEKKGSALKDRPKDPRIRRAAKASTGGA